LKYIVGIKVKWDDVTVMFAEFSGLCFGDVIAI